MTEKPRIRLVPYLQTEKYPTRVWAEQFESTFANGLEYWRPLRIYDTEEAARKHLRLPKKTKETK